ncbi:hypothetical protein SEA_HURRICANE_87 [Mycobacterium phage Hurricane]|uniref:Uncharacterized protein n=1 Tax=Mycobacterium phage Hurricane TaxID=2015810 RepID=A0A222ZKW9_9CAUD|nr:hypothetical protein I5G83_gp87 [Mycobacterium phage Hurricane]ASR84831.1 hypothetical protein SEA_HURRICANE_87 [Mycobacterium phage Hurricane]
MAREVAFLDGPLRGRVQTIDDDAARWDRLDVCYLADDVEQPAGQTVDDALSWLEREQQRRRVVTYRIFRSPYLAGPRWVAAVGAKVGQTVMCVVPFTDYAARNFRGSIDEILSELAAERLRQLCVAEGLVAEEIRERFRGSLAEAQAAAQPTADGGPDRYAAAAASLGGYVGDPDMRLSLWQAIAAAPAADVQEVRE